MATIDQSWISALERVRSARSSPILMPAALLVLVDMAKAREISRGLVPFAQFEGRFRALVSRCKPSAAGKAWLPFYHLSGRAGLWSLGKASQPATTPAGWKPTSRAAFTGQVDGASVTSELLPSLGDPNARERLRDAIYAFLERDHKDESNRLVDAHKTSSDSSQQ